jgi:hypothetical protein
MLVESSAASSGHFIIATTSIGITFFWQRLPLLLLVSGESSADACGWRRRRGTAD